MRNILLGAAISSGGRHRGSRRGPIELRRAGLPIRHIIHERNPQPMPWPEVAPVALAAARSLCRHAHRSRIGGYRPILIGGDHSEAIGFWTGIHLSKRQAMGLIWIDAHLDSHTPRTSMSQRLHGMPLAVLLGHYDAPWQELLPESPVLLASAVTVIGFRSYEEQELELLKKSGVRLISMQNIQRNGWKAVWTDAVRRAQQAPGGYGISLDVDAIAPATAPGVSVPEPDGLKIEWVRRALIKQCRQPRLRALELAEFNPSRDRHFQTRRALKHLLPNGYCY